MARKIKVSLKMKRDLKAEFLERFDKRWNKMSDKEKREYIMYNAREREKRMKRVI